MTNYLPDQPCEFSITRITIPGQRDVMRFEATDHGRVLGRIECELADKAKAESGEPVTASFSPAVAK